MMRSRWIPLTVSVCAAFMLSGCGGGGGGGGKPNPPTPAPATLSTIAVTPANPSGVAGTTVQLSATGTYSNGTTQNLTSTVTWTSSKQDVATINNAGLATGTGPGTATVTATSGGVSGSTGLNMTAPMLSGTAAAGLPLVGTVTVKDALGATKTVTIGANGSYSVDVWGMTAPLVLRAEGNVGSTHYVIHSATAEIGAGGTVNITPLTDLIIANAAGQIAAAYFDSGDFAGLTRDELDAESAALKAKLLPVLQAMEVDASIDLLRTPFTPLASALDAALDVIRVSVDSATHIATILNLVNQISIADDIAVKAAAEANPPVLSADGTAMAADDLPLIRKAVMDFFDLFKTGLPQPAALLPLLSDDFLDQDQNREDFANEIATDEVLVGGSATDIVVGSLDYGYNNGASPLAIVGFRVLDADGRELGQLNGFTVIRGENGAWRLHGDQNALYIESEVNLQNDIRSGCRASGLEFAIEDNDTSNSATIDYVIVRGPGLPADGLRYNRAALGGDWNLVNPGHNPFWYPMTDSCTTFWGAAGLADATIAEIPDNATYSIKAYTRGAVEVPFGPYGTGAGQIIPKRPLTLVELNASTRFPAFTTSVDLQSYSGGEVTINATGVNPARGASVDLQLTANGLLNSIDADVTPAADGTFSHTFTLDSPAGAISERTVRVSSEDEYGRGFTSAEYYKTTYTVGGTITGLTGTGLTLRLLGLAGAPIYATPGPGATSFTFPAELETGATYQVVIVAAVTNPSQLCFPTTPVAGTIGTSNVAIAINCLNSAPYTASGNVSGLTANGLTLRMFHTDISYGGAPTYPEDLDVDSTDATFSFEIPANHAFNIGIVAQPTGLTCTVTHTSSFSLGPDITDLGIACIDHATSPLSGTYSMLNDNGTGRSYFNFNADGTYTTAMIHNDPDCNATGNTSNGNGVEYGVYTWDESTDAFQLPVLAAVDTNSECGLSSPNGVSESFSGYITRNGNAIELREALGGQPVATATAVESNPGTLVGAWVPEASNGELLVFHADGTFLWAETQEQANGQERGCYTVFGSAVILSIAASCQPDGFATYDLNNAQNGIGGFFRAGATGTVLLFTLEDADTLLIYGRTFKRTHPN